MANKREFKKFVEAVGGNVVSEMMTSYYNDKDADKEKIEHAIGRVLGATGAAKSNANVYFDRGVKSYADSREYTKAKAAFFKALFKKISGDFNREVNDAVKEFNAALPEDVKKSNKEAVADK